MTRQSKHIRFQIAHKAAQMITEEGISDYAFAKRKAAKNFGLMDGDNLPSNDEINQAIKEYQTIFNKKIGQDDLRKLQQQAYSIMIEYEKFNPYLVGLLAEDVLTKYPKIQINLYVENIKEIEYFLIENSIFYKINNYIRKSSDENKSTFMFNQNNYQIELSINYVDEVKSKNKKISLSELKKLIS